MLWRGALRGGPEPRPRGERLLAALSLRTLGRCRAAPADLRRSIPEPTIAPTLPDPRCHIRRRSRAARARTGAGCRSGATRALRSQCDARAPPGRSTPSPPRRGEEGAAGEAAPEEEDGHVGARARARRRSGGRRRAGARGVCTRRCVSQISLCAVVRVGIVPAHALRCLNGVPESISLRRPGAKPCRASSTPAQMRTQSGHTWPTLGRDRPRSLSVLAKSQNRPTSRQMVSRFLAELGQRRSQSVSQACYRSLTKVVIGPSLPHFRQIWLVSVEFVAQIGLKFARLRPACDGIRSTSIGFGWAWANLARVRPMLSRFRPTVALFQPDLGPCASQVDPKSTPEQTPTPSPERPQRDPNATRQRLQI